VTRRCFASGPDTLSILLVARTPVMERSNLHLGSSISVTKNFFSSPPLSQLENEAQMVVLTTRPLVGEILILS